MTPSNYTTLYRINIFLAFIILFVYGGVLMVANQELTPAGKKYVPIIVAVVPTLLLAIALACKKQLNIGRIASKAVGFLLLPFLPIGTVVGLVMLQNTKKPMHGNH